MFKQSGGIAQPNSASFVLLNIYKLRGKGVRQEKEKEMLVR